MRILLAALIIALTISSFSSQSAEPVHFELISDIQMGKGEIFDNSLLWLAENFRSSKDVVDLKDKDSGIIIGNGAVDIKVGWGVYVPARFKLKIEVKDNKYRLSFKDVILVFDGEDKPIESANRRSMEPKVIEKFNEMAISLQMYLIDTSHNQDW
jgi:hypothetical protein